jgi:hypothetical protein
VGEDLCGRNAMNQIVEKQWRVPGEWEYLHGFARRESQPVPLMRSG